MKKAFTLAEVMITLVVVGIITAVIIPVAINSKPNENIMKFKKAHNTLYQIIQTLITSDKYYLNGDLGMKPDGSLVNSATYFCETIADNVTAKKVQCSNILAEEINSVVTWHVNTGWNWAQASSDSLTSYLDLQCKTYIQSGEEIVLSDGVVIYEVSPAAHFGVFTCNHKLYLTKEEANRNNCYLRAFSDTNAHSLRSSDFDTVYKPICIDIDGINKGEDPFGYGIRVDGKILAGKRAADWLEKSIQN